jgi:hygromycin-B 7''-O-kinase
VELPHLVNLDEYRAIYHRDELWRPAIGEICHRHGIPAGSCVRGPDGTHIVYYADQSHVIKLFVPLFREDFDAERVVLRRVVGKLGVVTPTLEFEGKIAGWPYIVMSRLAGRTLGEVWEAVEPGNRLEIVGQIGELIARTWRFPTDGLAALTVDWPAFVARQAAGAVERHAGDRVGQELLDRIPAYLASVRPLLVNGFEPVLLFSDITDEHVLVSEVDGAWVVSGYVDFGDAMLGQRDYELVAPALDIALGDRDLLVALLRGSGYSDSDFTEAFRHRMMAYTLIHRYLRLSDVLEAVPEAGGARSPEELADFFWPV